MLYSTGASIAVILDDLTTASLSRVNCKVLGSKCMSFKNLDTTPML